MGNYREEHDLLGFKNVPSEAYYGIQTVRALENFNISGEPISNFPFLIKALGYVKKATALANREFNILSGDKTEAIVKACDEIIDGGFLDQFPVDAIQGGAGTSVNMNANEVIANRALELFGKEKGDYLHIHPNNHINLSQSTNDVYPTALRLAIVWKLERLKDSLKVLHVALKEKSEEFKDVLKMGRTQLQDAVPMTLGHEFGAWALMVEDDLRELEEKISILYTINMGATAIGTGITAPKGYAKVVTKHLAKLTNLPLTLAPDLYRATQDPSDFIEISSFLRKSALKVSKICNDLRLLSSGPRAGLGEINLPPMQPGSSIMPGKVNPVIPEVVTQVAFEVAGNDLTIAMAGEAGQLELNVMEPIMAYKLFTSINHYTKVLQILRDRCIVGITANRERLRAMVENSIGLVTALVPVIGYEACNAIAKKAQESGGSVYQIVLDEGHLSQEALDKLLSIESMF
ncbi:MAG: aspartate ammonia-lyase [Sphaerochaetaceae bacterium]|jgi:aspartate ammonia-lyase|nr:aspartate ammonia-lyase [Sphaerochaetaceae bacterium]HHU88083.1 aspartate ammonia-lyase [Spirochaetales bacterium]